MYKRKNTSSKQDNNKITQIQKKNPVQQVFSTLPQLAISFALLLFIFTIKGVHFNNQSLLFYISLLCSIVICGIFFILQLNQAEFKNWEKDPSTRKYIRIATLCAFTSFFGFNISLWSFYGFLTPVLIISTFINVLSIFSILLAFVVV